MDKATVEVSHGRGGVRRAPRFPAAIIAAMERFVVDQEKPDYLRGVAWLRLVKIWAVLRYDDHSWLAPELLSMVGGVLLATMTRTKTSGPGKQMPELPLVVSSGCFVAHPDWLRVGFDSWREIAPSHRTTPCRGATTPAAQWCQGLRRAARQRLQAGRSSARSSRGWAPV